MQLRVRVVAGALLTALLVTVAGCAGKGQPEGAGLTPTGARKGGTFTYAYGSDPTSLDPERTPDVGAVHSLIYDTLVVKGPDRKYYPALAEKWQVSPDGKVVTFNLKQGVKFHNGEPFNAESVKFTFDRAVAKETKSPQSGGFMGPYEKTEIVSDYEVKVYFKEPYAPIFQNLSTSFLAPLPPKAVKEKGDAFGREPIGTGAFKFSKWQNSDSIVLEKNPDWKQSPDWAINKGAMHFDRIVFKHVPDENSQLLALQNGEIDVLDIPGPQVEAIRKHPDYQFLESTAAGVVYLGINSEKVPFSDPKVRQAIASTIDRDELVTNGLFGLAVANYTPISPSVWGYDEGLKSKGWPLDLTRASQLLTEAGYIKSAAGKWEKDGKPLTFEIMTYTSQPYPRVAEVVQNQIAKLGITVTIKTLESASLLAATPKGQHDSVLIAYGWSDPDILFNFLHSSRLANSNRVHYVNTDLDKLLEQGRVTLNLDDRMKVYQQAQTHVLQNAPWVPLYTNKYITAVRKDVKGIKNAPDGTLYLYDAYKDVK